MKTDENKELDRLVVVNEGHAFTVLSDYCVHCGKSRKEIDENDLNCVVVIVT